MENVVIIGSGPAAHTAAIYTARADLNPLMYEGFMAGGVAAGGQLTTTTDVENFPGFPEGISGPKLMTRMKKQSEKYGTRIENKTVDSVDLSQKTFSIFVGESVIQTKTIIIATGATAKRMNIVGEDRLWQKGISACAVCDGALPLFRKKKVFVVGGGDSACEEACYLTKYSSRVFMIVRRDVFRASKVMQNRVFKNKRIEILFNTVIKKACGDNLLESLFIEDLKTKTEKEVEARGLFYAIGHKPNTDFLDSQIDLDESGYILTNPDSTRSSVRGVFACGDVQDKVYRQAITAAGSGCMAALDVERFLSD